MTAQCPDQKCSLQGMYLISRKLSDCKYEEEWCSESLGWLLIQAINSHGICCDQLMRHCIVESLGEHVESIMAHAEKLIREALAQTEEEPKEKDLERIYKW
jgi:hypothetical protein